MKSTHHQIEIFEDIINGDLEPIKLFQDKLDVAVNYLREDQEECQVSTFVKIDKRESAISHEEIIIPHIHPRACEFINQQTLQSSSAFKDHKLKGALQKLTQKNATNQTIVIEHKKYHLIGVPHTISWKDLDPYLIKICFYHKMLTEYVKSLKRNLFIEFYNLDDKTVKRLVNRTHTRLINFCDQVIHKYSLTASDLRINLRSAYTDKDCMAIVYNHLNDLINFLVNDYYFFLHAEAHVPYNAEILRRYQLEQTARNTIRRYKKLSIDDELKEILSDTINKVLSLDTKNRITYYEITYYSYFLNELYQFIASKTKVLDSDTLIIRLIELGFNRYEFIKYVTNDLENKSQSLPTILYLEHLQEKRKEWEQCIICENRIFDKELEPAHVSLMNWLDSEIQFYMVKLEQDNSADQKQKLEVDLSVSQLALMTRLFHESAMSSKTSISEVASYVVENYRTQKSSSISLKSFKNNLYKLDDSTINEVKSKLIEMVNRVNEL